MEKMSTWKKCGKSIKKSLSIGKFYIFLTLVVCTRLVGRWLDYRLIISTQVWYTQHPERQFLKCNHQSQHHCWAFCHCILFRLSTVDKNTKKKTIDQFPGVTPVCIHQMWHFYIMSNFLNFKHGKTGGMCITFTNHKINFSGSIKKYCHST